MQPTTPTFPSASFTFSPDWLWLLFYLAALVFMIHAIVVIYHWYTFGTSGKWQLSFSLAYLAGGAVLFLVMLGLLLTHT